MNDSGIILYAKQSGPTSFSSLNAIKKAFNTKKVGHTGTLDSFAEGLMVVLVGKMTKLVPYIISADKTYEAVIQFGVETDTLEVTGKEIKTASIPSLEQIQEIFPKFIGTIEQTPPLYSAIHINGKRASDMIRSGEEVKMPSRFVHINSLILKEYKDGKALIEVSCSKGTYIRSLARDIANAVNSCGYLVALRRTKVGPFSLNNAIFVDKMENFSINSYGAINEKKYEFSDKDLDTIRAGLITFSPDFALDCGFEVLFLYNKFINDFFDGKPLRKNYFLPKDVIQKIKDIAVFTEDNKFIGVIKLEKSRFKYCFVIPKGSIF